MGKVLITAKVHEYLIERLRKYRAMKWYICLK